MRSASPTQSIIEAPFFKLPAELRNVIYEDVLGDLSNAFSCFGGVTYVQYRSVSILFVNRQMYQDTHLLPYSMNSITAGPRTGFKEWMGRRTRNQLRAMSCLHFVFNDFYDHRQESPPQTASSFGYSDANNFAMESLLSQQLAFPEMTGLNHILIELRSRAEAGYDIAEQLEFLQEAKLQIERLNPQVNVSVDLVCQGCTLFTYNIPASPATGLRIVRFDKLVEGGRSKHDFLERNLERRQNLRRIWQTVSSQRIKEDQDKLVGPSLSPSTEHRYDVIDDAHFSHSSSTPVSTTSQQTYAFSALIEPSEATFDMSDPASKQVERLARHQRLQSAMELVLEKLRRNPRTITTQDIHNLANNADEADMSTAEVIAAVADVVARNKEEQSAETPCTFNLSQVIEDLHAAVKASPGKVTVDILRTTQSIVSMMQKAISHTNAPHPEFEAELQQEYARIIPKVERAVVTKAEADHLHSLEARTYSHTERCGCQATAQSAGAKGERQASNSRPLGGVRSRTNIHNLRPQEDFYTGARDGRPKSQTPTAKIEIDTGETEPQRPGYDCYESTNTTRDGSKYEAIFTKLHSSGSAETGGGFENMSHPRKPEDSHPTL
ncbi:hypothetical protein SVAN01_04281 [Stagonosporopsis vannaccii]|nr:hypothetical protein SVAN01_04281 [Stagonosporopsis vannaccii]